MKKEIYYKYLGTNGILETPIYIEGAYSICMVKLTAQQGKILTNGTIRTFTISVPKNEVELWEEIDF